MELKEKNIYIFTQKNTNHPTPWKGEILEITKTSIYIKNLDQNLKHRYTLEKFNNDLKPIELIHNFHENIEFIIKKINKQPVEFKKFEAVPFDHYIPKKCIGPCF
jgi:hypothetical protein